MVRLTGLLTLVLLEQSVPAAAFFVEAAWSRPAWRFQGGACGNPHRALNSAPEPAKICGASACAFCSESSCLARAAISRST
jgi:hypothetical protein